MSLTSKTRTRRTLRKKRLGRDAKRARAKAGTPPFPIDPAKAGPDSAEKSGHEAVREAARQATKAAGEAAAQAAGT